MNNLSSYMPDATYDAGYMNRVEIHEFPYPAGVFIGDEIVAWSTNTLEEGYTIE